jgi:hypothetical protein
MFKLSIILPATMPTVVLGFFSTLEECDAKLQECEEFFTLHEQGKVNLEDHPTLSVWEGSDAIATNTATGETYVEDGHGGWVKQ